jgi:hypothetical protein
MHRRGVTPPPTAQTNQLLILSTNSLHTRATRLPSLAPDRENFQDVLEAVLTQPRIRAALPGAELA